MSKAEHTRGPWVIDGVDCDTGGQHIMAENGNAICGLWAPGNTSCSYDEQAANARLIAAAPELLYCAEAAFDALDTLHNVIVKHGLNADGKFGYAWQQMIDAKEANRAAIAKAKGE